MWGQSIPDYELRVRQATDALDSSVPRVIARSVMGRNHGQCSRRIRDRHEHHEILQRLPGSRRATTGIVTDDYATVVSVRGDGNERIEIPIAPR
jgi:hypothetical protein